MLISLCAGIIKPVFEGDKISQLWKKMHQFIKCIQNIYENHHQLCVTPSEGEPCNQNVLRSKRVSAWGKKSKPNSSIGLEGYIHYGIHSAVLARYVSRRKQKKKRKKKNYSFSYFFREGSVGASLAFRDIPLGHRLLPWLAKRSSFLLFPRSPLFSRFFFFFLSLVYWFSTAVSFNFGFCQIDFGLLNLFFTLFIFSIFFLSAKLFSFSCFLTF